MNRESMIDLIIKSTCETEISYTVFVDISFARDQEEAYWMGDSAADEVPDLAQEAKDLYKEIVKQRKDLSQLATHEIEEKGEELGLWKCKEKQRRLIQ